MNANAELRRQLNNLGNLGTVIQVDAATAKMRLQIGDNQTDWIPIPAAAAGAIKIWRCPTIGEQFAILAPSGDLRNAIAVTSLYSDDNPPPVLLPDVVHIDFAGIGHFSLNTSTAHAEFKINSLHLDVAELTLSGAFTADGLIKSLIDVVADAISLKNHKTTGVRTTGSLIFGTFFAMIAGITKFALIMYLVNRVADRFGFGFGSRLALLTKGIRLFGSAFMFLAKNSIPMVIQGLISLSIALFTTPIGWLILAIGSAALLIIKYWQPIKAFFSGLWAGLVEGLAPLRATFSTVFDSMRDSLAPLAPLWDVLGNALGFVIDLIKQLFTPFQATSSELSNATTYGHAFGTMLADVINVVGTLIAMLIHLASFVIGTVIKGWQLIGETAAAMWVSISAFFSSGIANISASIVNWSPLQLFYTAFASVMSWFGIELPAKFTEFGSMILDGLKNGILSKVDSLKATLSNVMQSLPNWAKNVLDIHSPSRVFAQIGGYTMQGLEQGLLSGAAMPINAIGRTSQDMIKALDTSQIQIDRRPPLTAATASGRAGGQAAPVTINMTINAAAGMDTQQLAQLVAAEVAKATRPASNRAALYDME